MFKINLKQLSKKDRILRIVSYILACSIAIASIVMMIIHLCNGDPHKRVSSCILSALAVLIPFVLELIIKKRIGNSTIIAFLIFLFFSAFIGSAVGVMKTSSVYDKICHCCFGYLGCYIGLLIANSMLNKTSHPWHVALVCFLFVMACASIWEIYEFVCDSFFGGTAQGVPINGITPVTDTMLDITVTFIGAIVFFIHYMIHVVSHKNLAIDSFISDNNTTSRDNQILQNTQTDSKNESKQNQTKTDKHQQKKHNSN